MHGGGTGEHGAVFVAAGHGVPPLDAGLVMEITWVVVPPSPHERLHAPGGP